MVTKSQHRVSAGGSNYGTFTVEDTNSTLHLNLFKEDYLKYKHFLKKAHSCTFAAFIRNKDGGAMLPNTK
ncbi:MAG: hypothetical protein IPL35_17580 [Sphingobacteriales bacterium]|nr:hypothetical protein [Sphingobacteriales bacterium]